MTYPISRCIRRGAARVTVGAVVAGGLLALSAPGAQAKPVTITYDTAGQYRWFVPDSVTSLHLVAYGGQGGSGPASLGDYGEGGKGAQVTADLPVIPGQWIDVAVAGAGHGSEGGVGAGGDGGVGTAPGGGGGGATWVQSGGYTYLVAAGGGGAAVNQVDGGSSGQPGTDDVGQAHGLAGGAAVKGSGGPGGTGGRSAGLPAGCSFALAGPRGADGASSAGAAGGGRQEDGDVPRSGGGGGGGGYFGGGGGGGGAYCASDGTIRHGSGGGGGGGYSHVDDVARNAVVTEGVRSGDGAISITYDDPWAPTSGSLATPRPNDAGWNNSAVTVHWNWRDLGSGLDPHGCTSTSSSDGRTGRLQLSAGCRDLAGNATTATHEVNIDTTPPSAAATQSGREVLGWSRGPVRISWNWTDALSGLDPAACPKTTKVTRQGVRTTTVTCQDLAGNATTASQTTKVDDQAPRIKVKRPKHRTYHQGQYVVAKYRCRDAGVGVASCHGSVRPGHALHTKKLGQHTLRIKAKDRLGNVRTVRVHYRVVR